MALKYSGVKIELREVTLKDMPAELLKLSSAETVPVLQLSNETVMDESWDIVKWALSQNDSDNWLGIDSEHLLDAEILVETNDFSFKEDLDHYKYADRFPEHSEEYYRRRCEKFLEELEEALSDQSYLLSESLTLADIAVFPFVRQFSLVDKNWFDQSSYINVKQWLSKLIGSDLFENVFQKHEAWTAGDTAIYV